MHACTHTGTCTPTHAHARLGEAVSATTSHTAHARTHVVMSAHTPTLMCTDSSMSGEAFKYT